MKILILSHSPKINTTQSRIGRDLCSFLKTYEDDTYMFCSHHDSKYYPSNNNVYSYCNFEFFPSLSPEEYIKEYHDLIYKIKPDVVIFIGSHRDIENILDSKFKSNHNYKFGLWNIFIEDEKIIKNNKHLIELCDFVFCFDKNTECFGEFCADVFGIGNFIIPGETIKFNPKFKNEKLSIGAIGKNMSSSDIGSFFSLAKKINDNFPEQVCFKLLTNKYDRGDNQLDIVNSYYENIVDIYDNKYTSIKDSITDLDISDFYSSLDFILDTSCCFNCGATNLEAIKCGAIPLLINNPINSDIIDYFEEGLVLPSQYRFMLGNKLNFLNIELSSQIISDFLYNLEKDKSLSTKKTKIKDKSHEMLRRDHFVKVYEGIKNTHNSPLKIKIQSINEKIFK